MERPWPGQARTVWGDHERYVQTYFSTYKPYYFTGDGCRRDEDGYHWITGRAAAVLDVKATTEPDSRPHKRKPACQNDQAQHHIRALLQSRATRPKDMREGDAAIVLDGGKLVSRAELLKPVKDFTGETAKLSTKMVAVV